MHLHDVSIRLTHVFLNTCVKLTRSVVPNGLPGAMPKLGKMQKLNKLHVPCGFGAAGPYLQSCTTSASSVPTSPDSDCSLAG